MRCEVIGEVKAMICSEIFWYDSDERSQNFVNPAHIQVSEIWNIYIKGDTRPTRSEEVGDFLLSSKG